MSYGFEIRGDDGTAIVSDRTYNPVYVGDAAVQRTQRAPTTFTYFGAMLIYQSVFYRISCANRPMVFVVQAGATYHSVLGIDQVSAGVWEIVVAVTDTTTPRVLCFDSVPAGAGVGTGWGIEVRDGAGALCFSSNLNHLVIDDFVVLPTIPTGCTPSYQSSTYYYPYPVGSTSVATTRGVQSPALCAMTAAVAVCRGQDPYHVGAVMYGVALQCVRITSGVVETAWGVWQIGNGQPPGGTLNHIPQPVAVLNAGKYP